MSAGETTQVRRFWPPWGRGSPTLFLLSVAFMLAMLAVLFVGEDSSVFGRPVPSGVGLVLSGAAMLSLFGFALVEKGKNPVIIGSFAVFLCWQIFSNIDYRMRTEEWGLQQRAALTVWREANCTRDSSAPGCEDFLRLFSSCAPEVPASACMREIAPYLEEARARRTAASAP